MGSWGRVEMKCEDLGFFSLGRRRKAAGCRGSRGKSPLPSKVCRCRESPGDEDR